MPPTGSSKELFKALQSYLSNPSLPLPEDVADFIDAYLHRHEKFDQATSDRLHDELLSLYYRYVSDQPNRYGAFASVLALLVPTIRTPNRIFEWWDILSVKFYGHAKVERGPIGDLYSTILDHLTGEEEDEASTKGELSINPIVERLLQRWMNDGITATATLQVNGDHKANAVRDALIYYGKRKPKNFFIALNQFFVQRDHRKRTAALLCEFIQKQPPHLHQVVQTPLFANLLRCLQHDDSTTVVSITLTAVIMLLPHMPTNLVPHLPSLFNAYARLLFWHRERTQSIDSTTSDLPQRKNSAGPGVWEACPFSPEADDLQIPHLRNYFTILYGLYPINFMDYIRKPQRYLRHANQESAAEDVDVQSTEIRHQSEQFRRGHLLHPNFYTLTIDSEKTDTGRWLNSEPAELVSESMALCLLGDAGSADAQDTPPMPGAASILQADEADREGASNALLSTSLAPGPPSWHSSQWASDSAGGSRVQSTVMRQNSQSSTRDSTGGSRVQSTVFRQNSQSSTRDSTEVRAAREPGGDSPTLPPHLVQSTSQTQLQDLVNSNKALKELQQTLSNDSVPSLSLSHQESIPERGQPQVLELTQPLMGDPSGSGPGVDATVARLQRQILLLQNDLHFERYMKQQHLGHIGELRRRLVKEAASEAGMQNLVMEHRSLKHRFEEAKKAEVQVRKDSEKSRILAKKWEADLSTKLRNFREESKKSKISMDALQRELEEAKTEGDKLRNLVCEAEVRELNWKQNLQADETNANEMNRLMAEIKRLTIVEQNFKAKEGEMDAALRTVTDMTDKMQMLQMQLEAREKEVKQVRSMFESQILALKSRLTETHDPRGSRRGISVNSTLESALAASRAKQSDLQRQYSLLMRKYTALHSSLLDMRCAPGSNPRPTTKTRGGGADGSLSEGESDRPPTTSSSPVLAKTRPHRVFSDPEVFEPASSTTTTWTPDTATGSASGSRSSSVGPGDDTLGPSVPVPWGLDGRYHGRGGVQNRVHKEPKDKRKEDGERKDKKSTGIRGIRNISIV